LSVQNDALFARSNVARKNYLAWKRQATVFSDMAAFREMGLEETGVEHPVSVSTGFASANLFPMLGARPQTGRLFQQSEERDGADRVAILSDAYWDRRFHRDPSVIGKTVTLGGVIYTVIGVLPPRFHLPATWEGEDQLRPEVWVPLSRLWRKPEDDTARQLLVTARLKPGVSVSQARAEMTALMESLAKEDPKLNEVWRASVFPFAEEDASPKLRRALYMLLGAVAFLLLIACANLANLTLARTALRTREIAVRLALGATRGRIVGQLVLESLLVSLAGATVGLLLAHWGIRLILALKPPDVQRPELIGLNLPVLAFSAAVCVLTAVLFGLAPAMSAGRADLNTALRAGGWGSSAARTRSRQFLIAVEVALAVALLAGAGLMIRSLRELIATGIGFDTSRMATVDIELPAKRYPDGPSRSRFLHELLERARGAPGVTSAAIVDCLPLHRVTASNFYIAGRPEPRPDSLPIADKANVSPSYFRTIGLRLLAGRGFTERDLAMNEGDKDGVAIVNQAFASQFFKGENPIGQHLQEGDRKRLFEIVGVAANYHPMGAENAERSEIFYPYLKLDNVTLIARTAGAPELLAKSLQDLAWSMDKELPRNRAAAMDYYVDEWQSQRKFNTLLLGIFAGLALALAAMGIYGVLSNLVASRIREIGIRMAIGATPSDIGRLVLRQGMMPVWIGLAAGLAGAVVLGRFVEALLFHVGARDPLTLALVAAAILTIAPAAIYLPLRRATRVDCTIALREE
jgi:putative ABC transport system permease protein